MGIECGCTDPDSNARPERQEKVNAMKKEKDIYYLTTKKLQPRKLIHY